MNIFGPNAIVDRSYYPAYAGTKRYTVTHIRFELVPEIVAAVYLAADTATTRTQPVFWGQSDFHTEGDTLVIQVYLDIADLSKGTLLKKFALEDKYLQMALVTLAIATGEKNSMSTAWSYSNAVSQIQNLLYNGQFPWPVQITDASL
jgi:hypothetical protein